MNQHSGNDTIARLLDAALHSLRVDVLPQLADDGARMRVDHITRLLRAAASRLSCRQAGLERLVADAAAAGILNRTGADSAAGDDDLEQQRQSIEEAISQYLPDLLAAAGDGNAQALRQLESLVTVEKDFLISQDADILRGSQVVYRGGRIDEETTAKNSEPWPIIDETALTVYLRQRENRNALRAENVRAIPGGFSKQTILYTQVDDQSGTRDDRVIRKDMPVPFIDKFVADEFGLLTALHSSGFPVARPLWLETDHRCLGGGFLVSERVAGTSNAASWAGNPAMTKNACNELARILAWLHRYSPSDLGYPRELAARSAGELMEDEIERWTRLFHARRREPMPLQELPLVWLARNIPAALYERPARVLHGDFGFHNLMFDEHGKVTALLDWEFSVLGDPTQDLCFARLFVEPLMSWPEFLELYLAYGGVAPCEEAVFFFDLWTKTRNSIGCVAAQNLFDTVLPQETKFALAGHVFGPYLYIEECESVIAHLKRAHV